MSNINQVEFPRQPYEGQRRLAQSIYSACKNGETAVFESPTGTGKTLSLLCATLSYLNDEGFNRSKVTEQIADLKREYDTVSNDKSLANEVKFKQMYLLRSKLDEFEDQIRTQDQIECRLKEAPEESMRRERQQHAKENNENFAIDGPDSDDIDKLGKRIKKLIYVSRTHSQLTQFIREINNPLHKQKRPVQIGSRASFCLNSSVNSLPSALVNCECARLVKNSATIDIEDIEMNDTNEPSSSAKRTKKETCPYYKRSKILELRSRIWNGVLLDSKTSLKEEGQKLGACPFFAAKAALPLCDVVAMPYNILFDKVSRDSYGINLQDNVVVIDEAHNFLTSVFDTASFNLNLDDLDLAKNALEFYLTNTRSTKQDKLLAIRQIVSALERFCGVLKSKTTGDEVKLLTPVEIQRDMATTTDYLKLSHLIEAGGLLRESRGILNRYWSFKNNHSDKPKNETSLSALASLVRKTNAQKETNSRPSTGTPRPLKRTGAPIQSVKNAKISKSSESSTLAMTQVSSSQIKPPIERLQIDGVQLFAGLTKLFRALLQSDSAKFIYQTKEKKIRYIRLDIDSDLQKVIKESRAFIMTGGTMRPKNFISAFLKSNCSIAKITEEQFGHVISPRNLLPLVISNDLQNNPLCLKVSNLNNTILERYAKTLAELLKHIPYGCVVFLPNYNLIMTFEKLMRSLKPRKEIFTEKKGQDVEELIRKYTQFAQASRDGAVLFASAAGRLGEGINFSDNLARAVIMIGLPYPNAMDIETKLRATHAVEQKLCTSVYDYLGQACTRVVAQCMGRAIRHGNDFASLIFMDSRYERSSNTNQTNEVVANLPEWMIRDLRSVHAVDFPTVFPRFFNPLLSDFDNKNKLK